MCVCVCAFWNFTAPSECRSLCVCVAFLFFFKPLKSKASWDQFSEALSYQIFFLEICCLANRFPYQSGFSSEACHYHQKGRESITTFPPMAIHVSHSRMPTQNDDQRRNRISIHKGIAFFIEFVLLHAVDTQQTQVSLHSTNSNACRHPKYDTRNYIFMTVFRFKMHLLA